MRDISFMDASRSTMNLSTENHKKLVAALGRLRSLDVALVRHSEDIMYITESIEKNNQLKFFLENSMHIEIAEIYSAIIEALADGEEDDALIEAIDAFAVKNLKEKFNISY